MCGGFPDPFPCRRVGKGGNKTASVYERMWKEGPRRGDRTNLPYAPHCGAETVVKTSENLSIFKYCFWGRGKLGRFMPPRLFPAVLP